MDVESHDEGEWMWGSMMKVDDMESHGSRITWWWRWGPLVVIDRCKTTWYWRCTDIRVTW